MVLTILEGVIPPGKELPLQVAYRTTAASKLPPGLIRSELLRDSTDPSRWRIQTWWESAAALDAMRSAGTPAGILMFRAAGAEPTLSRFEVFDTLGRVIALPPA